MKQEIYKSTTHGPIPLSFTGRHLLQNLREATQAAISCKDWHGKGEAVSRARGELAKYMSQLEAKRPMPCYDEHSRFVAVDFARPGADQTAFHAWARESLKRAAQGPPCGFVHPISDEICDLPQGHRGKHGTCKIYPAPRAKLTDDALDTIWRESCGSIIPGAFTREPIAFIPLARLRKMMRGLHEGTL